MKNTVTRLRTLDARSWGKVLLVSGLLTLAAAVCGVAAAHSAVGAKVQLGLCLAVVQLGLSLLLWFPAARRLGVLIMLISVVHGGFVVVRAGTQGAQVLLPPPPGIRGLPLNLGNWRGIETQLDPETFVNAGALEAVSRLYTDRSGHVTKVLLALYTDPAAGVYHTPTNCYRSNGYTQLDTMTVPLQATPCPEIPVSLSTWEKKDDRVAVLYWYEMGKYTLFDRADWGVVRVELRGQRVWPPMYKVLLETPVAADAKERAHLLELAGSIRQWLGGLGTSKEAADAAP
jgi:EpsI family protein